MSRVVIVVDDYTCWDDEIVEASQRTVEEQVVSALKDAIALDSPALATVDVVETSQLKKDLANPNQDEVMDEDIIWCPLTLDVPHTLDFFGQHIFHVCKQERELRQWVGQKLGYATGESQPLGTLVLPVVCTAKGPIYAEVIGQGERLNDYYQPVDLPDKQRQPLYHLAYKVLQFLSAPPAVYLLVFGYNEQDIVFDKLIPFPAAPAIASLG
ncbi:MAG: hypothetical protein F6K28_45800, partial [Microcoleus sp. SIO2G3]|nr:hypothetical protein [Microcoleus sp. SIO2G3]